MRNPGGKKVKANRERVGAMLARAAGKLARGWCQLHDADNGNQAQEVDVNAPDAARWCLFGALFSVENEMAAQTLPGDALPYLCREDAIRVIRGFVPPNVDLAEWNDAPGRTQAEVLGVVLRAAVEVLGARDAEA